MNYAAGLVLMACSVSVGVVKGEIALAGDLPMPPPTTASSSLNHKAWEKYGHYWNADALLNRERVAVLTAQLALVEAANNNQNPNGSGVVALVAVGGMSVVGDATNAVGKATINWTYGGPVEGVNGFRVERSLDGVNFEVIGTVGIGARSFVDARVASGGHYWYAVRTYALAFAKTSAASNAVDWVAK